MSEQDEPVAPAAATAAGSSDSELAPAVDAYLPDTAVSDAFDPHETFIVLDDHDVRMLLEQVQSSALRRWIYDMPDGAGGRTQGLTVHAVQDICQRMNWTGKCRITVVPETLEVVETTQDAGRGPEPFWIATVFARDEVTGMAMPGTSMEPHRLRLKKSTADKQRRDGKQIPDDNAIFDVFSRTKAVNKAYRNALAAFIPEEIEQTVIAMFAKDPRRVERIQTEAEKKVAELPPPLDDERARELRAECEAIYKRIAELGAGKGKVEFPAGTFGAWMLQAQHAHDTLENFRDYLLQRETELAAKFEAAT